MDKEDEQKRKQRKDRTELEEQLRVAGEEIRTNALVRRRRNFFDDKEFQEYTESLPQIKKAKLNSSSLESDEDEENVDVQ